jgi:ABC-2 type transport system ATP-binding protein
MIEVTGLTKFYGNKKAVEDLNFTIDSGEVVGFLGPNGAGKSTTMNILTGYLSATSGTARIDGMDILDDAIEAKRHIGYMPEQPPLYLDMTVDEYLFFAAELKGVKQGARRAHIGEICESVGVSHVRGRLIRNLSKGYKQRVGLAMALIGDPDTLILDEPTVGLDPIQIIEIRNVIKELGRRRTVVLSSHILSEVQAICERVLVINNGTIVANDTPENLSANISGEHKLDVTIAGPQNSVTSALRSVDGMRAVTLRKDNEDGTCSFIIESDPSVDIRKPMFFALAGAGYPILSLQPLDMSLEDIFLRLTVEETGASRKPRRRAIK